MVAASGRGPERRRGRMVGETRRCTSMPVRTRAGACGDELEQRLQLSPVWRSCMRAMLPKLAAAAERRAGAELLVAASLRTCSACVLRSGAMRVVCRRRRPAVPAQRLCTRAMPPNCVAAVGSMRASAQSTVVHGAEHARATHGQLCAAGVSLRAGRRQRWTRCEPLLA